MNDGFLASHMHLLEDFWRRRESALEHILDYQAFGFPVTVLSNHPRLLEGARISGGHFSKCETTDESGRIHICLVVDESLPAAPILSGWVAQLRYFGVGDWLTINAEPWLNAAAHLIDRRSVAIISQSLLDHPHLYSRYILDTITLNMVTHSGLGMVHASCVHRDKTAYLLSATHNTGKSTTAFRLALAGYQFVADGMTFVRVGKNGIELMGYPVGEVKLRLDTIQMFPMLNGHGRDVVVREDKKLVFNLRSLLPSQVLEGSIYPERIIVLLMERTNLRDTHLEAIGKTETLEGLFPETMHLDREQIMENNLQAVRVLLEKAQTYRLLLGSDEDKILSVLAEL